MKIRIPITGSVVALLGVCSSFGAVVSLNFSGTYDTRGRSVLGQSGTAVPYSYNLTYDTNLDTDLNYFSAGEQIGSYTTTHEWYGYSRSGIISSDLIFGSATWSASDLVERTVVSGTSSDVWFDSDLANATPTRAWMFFDLGGPESLQIGESTADATNIYLSSNLSYVANRDGNGFSDNMNISVVPEVSSLSILVVWSAFTILIRKR